METSNGRIFVSYCHGGNGLKWKLSLLHALNVFERQNLLDVWEDGKIRVGSFWDDDIYAAMSSAKLAIILLTDEALRSDYIVSRELPFLKERQSQGNLVVIPVVCEQCDWKSLDWIRATQIPNESNPLSELSKLQIDHIFRTLATDIAERLSQMALAEAVKHISPTSRTRVYLDKFPLTSGGSLHQEKLIGREQELALLDLAFTQPNTAIVSLVAWGGVGKTMLVQNWLRRLQREAWFGAEYVYAWSFFSQGIAEDRLVSEDMFLANALECFGVECEPTLSPGDKGRLLADTMLQRRTLLILDGIEPLQHPPGPMGGQLRAAGVHGLLKQFARKANQAECRCLCFVTTREPLTDFLDFERGSGAAWGSALRLDLDNLTERAGAALLHYTGANRAGASEIEPDDPELLAASREVGGHALTLKLLGRFLARAHGADIRRREFVKFEEADRLEQGGTTFKMLAAFENWFAKSGEFGARQLAILRILGLFDRPAEAGCMGALRCPPVIAGLTDSLFITLRDTDTGETVVQPLFDEDWNTATSFLTDFGLIKIQTGVDDHELLLDSHPLIREYFGWRLLVLCEEACRLAQERLYRFLSGIADAQPGTVSALQPLYHAVVHGCEAKLYDQAFQDTYVNRIERGDRYYSTRTLGLYNSALGILAHFYDKRWTTPTILLSPSLRAELLGTTGFYLHVVGRPDEAREPMMESVNLAVLEANWLEAAIGAINLCELESTLGSISKAVLHGKKSVALADRSLNDFYRILTRSCLAEALFEIGRRDAAEGLFKKSEKLQSEIDHDCQFLTSVSGARFCNLILDPAEQLAWHNILNPSASKDTVTNERVVERCLEVERRVSFMLKHHSATQPSVDIARYHLLLGKALLLKSILGGQDFASTDDNFMKASDYSLRTGYTARVPIDHLNRAWLRVVQKRIGLAQEDLDIAWDIAVRARMRLLMADIHLYRARLFFREEVYPWRSPADDLAAAEKLISECGYHRRDQELADAKRAIYSSVSEG
jgi:hypothetical protein